VRLDVVPDKLNPVIRPLMDCMKKEENYTLQVCLFVGSLFAGFVFSTSDSSRAVVSYWYIKLYWLGLDELTSDSA